MPNKRPISLIVTSDSVDQTSNDPKPLNKLRGHSSSSSIDSNSFSNAQQPVTTSTTTTTDSDMESEQDDQMSSDRSKKDLNSSDIQNRRLKHFHKLFKSEIKDEAIQLIDSYVCAYQGDILLQGKMYITDRYLCFHSRIISYITKHVYRWDQIETVAKERVAYIFPTAIGIQLKSNGKKIIYASFISRDQAFDKILLIWSRATNQVHTYVDDEDTELDNEGTLKPNSMNCMNGTDQGEVLKMCLENDNQGKKRLESLSSKSSDEKVPVKTGRSLSQKRFSLQTSKSDAKLSNGTSSINPTNERTSRKDKRDSKHSKKEHRSGSRSVTKQVNGVELSPTENFSIVQSNSSSSSINLTNHSDISTINDRSGHKIFHILMSLINTIRQYFSSVFHQLKSYSRKTTIILCLFIILLVFHSFYLIQLAYRIEDRLQSLHHLWPLTSKKNSPQPVKDL